MLELGRAIVSDPQQATQREWLVTNGIGGYASGTLAGVLSRTYHGLLVAALAPPLGRTVLVSKVDATAGYDGRDVPLFSNQWAADTRPTPDGFHHVERVYLEGTTPVWTYAVADARLERRVWMEHGANTTYLRYDLRHATRPLTLAIKVLVNYVDFHATTEAGDWQMGIEPVDEGLRVTAHDGATPFFMRSATAEATAHHEWYRGYHLAVEAYRGQKAETDHLHAATFRATLRPGESVTLVFSTEPDASLDGDTALQRRRDRERALLAQGGLQDEPGWVQHLLLAADQFLVRRATEEEPDGRTVLAGYHWFSDWGRDTMIALPGLTLATGRSDEAATILRTFARFVDQGMLPNRFPDSGDVPEYNTADATLWYVQALAAYLEATGDEALLRELFPVLRDIVVWHEQGTRYGIGVDPDDGLLRAGEPGVQLTWMDAKVDEWVVTPRIGKPVEINALWHSALRHLAAWAARLGEPADEWAAAAERARRSFGRFWNGQSGFCYDVLDGPDGDDPTLRPNQLFAVSLPHSPLSPRQQRAVVDSCARHLLTTLGLRSLSPEHPDYIGHYGGDRVARDGAYHQGTAWAWLIGPFVAAHWRVYGDADAARAWLRPFGLHLLEHGIGSIAEIADGDPPHTPRGCIAQAWSVAEVLRVWKMVANGE